MGPFQLPEYFNNSGDFLIPRELVLLHTQEKELENHQFNERRLLSLLQTHVDPHLGILNSSASLDVTSILASSLRSQNLKGRKLTSEMFPYTEFEKQEAESGNYAEVAFSILIVAI